MLATAGWIDVIGRSLREGFFMFWDTLWPLVLGFGLSGAVQAFVSRESMQSKMGDHGPAAVTRASLFGMVSSSKPARAANSSPVRSTLSTLSSEEFSVSETRLAVESGNAVPFVDANLRHHQDKQRQ